MESDSPMQETVYGTNNDDNHVVMSERVQSLAATIYQEFEQMIGKYDEDVVKQLMPLVVNVLESLDLAFVENQEHEVELELLREDNEQLVTQYEREKQLRKSSEQKLLELEYSVDEVRTEEQGKIESLESIARFLELKNKNISDQVSRLEEKETDMKKEYAKLHDRYTELFKTHMDYQERTKILYGTDRLESLTSKARHGTSYSQAKSGSAMYSVNSGETSLKSINSPVDYPNLASPNRSTDSSTSLKSELQEVQSASATTSPTTPQPGVRSTQKPLEGQRGGWLDGFGSDLSEVIPSTPELEDVEDISLDASIGPDRTTINREQRRPNTLYQELQFNDPDALGEVDEGADITGGYVHPGDYASSDSESDNESENKKEEVSDNFFGMGKEVENLIMENNELLATKNALNIVKDDLIAKVDELTSEHEILREEIKSHQAVKERLKQRVLELEEELKKLKEEMEKAKTNKSDDEEDVPMAQRKRFTRVEMARVLMERNQYKERLMELQDAVRWTEMIRASRNDPTLEAKKNRSSIWKFFSNLFGPNDKPQRKAVGAVNIRYNAPTSHVSPALDTMRRRRLGDRHRGLDFLDSDFASEKLQQQRARERREQYKQVRAHVRKDDGRMQAYGWSLPTKVGTPTSKGLMGDAANATKTISSQFPVPVPVYCRPLMDKELGMKIWCAAGVNLTGGRTQDGGSIVGASVFYSAPLEATKQRTEHLSEVDKLDQELKEHEKDRMESERMEQYLSSFVWICTSTHASSRVTVIDANNPADVLDSFHVCSSHLLCIASVPGARETDYPVDEEFNRLGLDVDNKAEEATEEPADESSQNQSDSKDVGNSANIGSITFVSCATGSTSGPPSPKLLEKETKPVLLKQTSPPSATDSPKASDDCLDVVTVTSSEDGQKASPQQQWLLIKEVPDLVKDGVSEVPKDNQLAYDQVEKMSSVLPTMWLGSHSGSVFVHSSVSQWQRCIHSVKLKDSVLGIVHVKGRVFAALADGTVAIFHRALDGQWDLTNYHLLDLGRPHHSIRCMSTVHNKVWCGYRNRIHVVDPKTLTVEKSFDAHPRKESQVRQMAWVGDGVWVSIRLDSTLRLYHAHTHQHLQDVDIEPYVSKMLGTGKLGFSFVRITSLLISCNRLWMGTGNGVIISVPLSESSKASSSSSTCTGGRAPGGVVRVYSDGKDSVAVGSFIPYCSMAQAQLSFHGHRDAVRFFVSVPGHGVISTINEEATTAVKTPVGTENPEDAGDAKHPPKPKHMLVMSGGEGYIDFRIGDGEEEEGEGMTTVPAATSCERKPQHGLSKGERSHLIVWEVTLGD